MAGCTDASALTGRIEIAFIASSQLDEMSLRKLVKDMMLLVSFHSDLFIALTKETAVSRKEILHDSNKEIYIWSLDWKSSLYQKTNKPKKNKQQNKQILYNLIKNNTVVAICFLQSPYE